jgi:multidrug efflux system membrane fusion protein
MTQEAPASGSNAPLRPPGVKVEARPRRMRPALRVGLLVLAAAGFVGIVALSRPMFGRPPEGATSPAGARRGIPVVGAAATVGDLGLTETGLGTVVPIATVTVRSRIDGQLVRLAYHEGQTLREGDLLAEIDPRPYQVQLLEAEGQLSKDEAALANAKVDLERYRVLIAQDSVPRQQLDTQTAVVNQAEAAVKSDQAQVEGARLNLTYCHITAPISGVVGLRLVDQGNMVHASDANGLAVMTQQQPISVVFTIPADHLPPLLARMKGGAKLPVEAWDRDLHHKLADGEVLAIDNQIDPTTGTVKIKAIFQNEDRALYPNQFVNARLLSDTLHGAVLVPAAAIERGPQSSHVYVVKPDSTVELRTVVVQATEGDVVALKEGLAGGEVVVVDGLDKLQPGATVTLSKEGGSRKPAP